jgi:PASTA domain
MPQIEFSVININAAFFNESGKAARPLQLALQFYNAGANTWQIISTPISTEKGVLSRALKPTARTAGFSLLKELCSAGCIPAFRLAIAASLKSGMTLVASEAPGVQFDAKAKALTLDFGKYFAQPEAIIKNYLLDEVNATTKLYGPFPAVAQVDNQETGQLKKELALQLKKADTLEKTNSKLENANTKLLADLEKVNAGMQETVAMAETAAAEAAAIKKELVARDKAILKIENEKVKAEAQAQKRLSDMESRLATSMVAIEQLDNALLEKENLIRDAAVTAAGQLTELDLLRNQLTSLDATIKQNVETIQALNTELAIKATMLESKDKIIAEQAMENEKLQERIRQMSQEAVEYKPVAQPVSRVYSSILDEFKKTTELTKDSNYKLANISLNIKTFVEFDDQGMRMQMVDANKLSSLPTEALSDFRVEIGESSLPVTGTTRVPNLLGLTETAARKVLSSLGLNLKPVYQQNKAVPNGQSFKQSPAAGDVLPGTDVTIVFSKL